MKLVDIFWHSHVKNWWKSFQKYQEEQEKQLLLSAKMEARSMKEDVEKIKDMKVAVFGKYICRVPVYKVERYRDGESVQARRRCFEIDSCIWITVPV